MINNLIPTNCVIGFIQVLPSFCFNKPLFFQDFKLQNNRAWRFGSFFCKCACIIFSGTNQIQQLRKRFTSQNNQFFPPHNKRKSFFSLFKCSPSLSSLTVRQENDFKLRLDLILNNYPPKIGNPASALFFKLKSGITKNNTIIREGNTTLEKKDQCS